MAPSTPPALPRRSCSQLPLSSQHSLQLVPYDAPRHSGVHLCESMCRARDPVTGWFSVPLQLGLFASALFKKKDFIAPFRGDLISLEEAEHRTAAGQGGYQIRVSRTLVLDCFRTSRDLLCMASFANSSHNLWNLATDAKAQNNAKLFILYEDSPPRLSVCLYAICMFSLIKR